jgi:hypothetical protein
VTRDINNNNNNNNNNINIKRHPYRIIIIIIIILLIQQESKIYRPYNRNTAQKECYKKVIIGAIGTISKSFKYQSKIPDKHDIKELQKTATMGTAHVSVMLM